jgi:hypothetical protein
MSMMMLLFPHMSSEQRLASDCIAFEHMAHPLFTL